MCENEFHFYYIILFILHYIVTILFSSSTSKSTTVQPSSFHHTCLCVVAYTYTHPSIYRRDPFFHSLPHVVLIMNNLILSCQYGLCIDDVSVNLQCCDFNMLQYSCTVQYVHTAHTVHWYITLCVIYQNCVQCIEYKYNKNKCNVL